MQSTAVYVGMLTLPIAYVQSKIIYLNPFLLAYYI